MRTQADSFQWFQNFPYHKDFYCTCNIIRWENLVNNSCLYVTSAIKAILGKDKTRHGKQMAKNTTASQVLPFNISLLFYLLKDSTGTIPLFKKIIPSMVSYVATGFGFVTLFSDIPIYTFRVILFPIKL